MRTITLYDLVQAMKKNGYEQSYGKLIEFEGETFTSPIKSACAIGQGMANLRIRNIRVDGGITRSFVEKVMRWNDVDHLTLKEIFEKIDSKWSEDTLKNTSVTVHDWEEDRVNLLMYTSLPRPTGVAHPSTAG